MKKNNINKLNVNLKKPKKFGLAPNSGYTHQREKNNKKMLNTTLITQKEKRLNKQRGFLVK